MRGVQAAVMEALGLGDSANLLPPEQLSRGLIQAFANFVQSRGIHPLKTQPKHTPQLYLQIWSCIQDMGEAGFMDGAAEPLEYAGPMHPGLVSAVPRKRRSGAAHCQVRPAAPRAAWRPLTNLYGPPGVPSRCRGGIAAAVAASKPAARAR